MFPTNEVHSQNMQESLRCGQRNIIIPTVLGASGETGVQTHFNTLCEYLSKQETHAVVLSPDRLNRWFTRLLHYAPLLCILKFSTEWGASGGASDLIFWRYAIYFARRFKRAESKRFTHRTYTPQGQPYRFDARLDRGSS